MQVLYLPSAATADSSLRSLVVEIELRRSNATGAHIPIPDVYRPNIYFPTSLMGNAVNHLLRIRLFQAIEYIEPFNM